MNKQLQSLSFEVDATWSGVSLAHLLALNLSEGRSAFSVPDLLEIYFSTHVIRVEGTQLRLLWQALLDGAPTEEAGKPRGYQITGVEMRTYKDDPDTPPKPNTEPRGAGRPES